MAGNNVKITVGVDNADAVRGLSELERSLGAAEKSASSFFEKGSVGANAFSSAIGNMAANLATKALSALGSFGAEMLRDADHCRKLSEALGMTVQDTAGFERAVKMAGGSAEGFGTAMRGLAKALDPAEVTENRKALEQLGISVKDSNGGFVSQKELLLRVADAYNAETDATKKARIGMDAFGKSAGEMTVFLNQGRQAIEEQVSMYGKASGYTDDYARTVEKLNDAMAEAKMAAMGLMASIADSDAFQSAIGWVKDLTAEWTKFLGERSELKKREKEDAENAKKVQTAELRVLEFKRAQLEYSDKTHQERKKETTEIDKQVAILRQKLNLGQQELALMNAAVHVSALQRKENLSDSEKKELEFHKNTVAYLEKELALKSQTNKAGSGKTETPKDDKATKTYEAENEKLLGWLENYKKSKMDETQIARAAYDEQLRQFNELLTRQKISYDEFEDYQTQAKASLDSKLEDIEKKRLDKEQKETDAFFAEAEKKEKDHQDQLLRIREALARTDEERKSIELERIKSKYAEEERLARETGIAIADIREAQESELAAIEKRYTDDRAAAERAASEASLALRETAAASDEERLNLQLERIDMRYDAELQKAIETNGNIAEIERARVAEIEATEKRIQLARAATASQYTNAGMQMAKSMAALGKASGETMKGIAITEAIINSSLAFTKALASAPPPLNGILAAAALASGMAQVATIQSQKFAKGGVVAGNSYYGDKVPVQVNSGEMILNREQQKKLFNQINSKDGSKQTVVNFSPQIAQGINSEDVKKMLKECSSEFEAFIERTVSTGAGKTKVFV